MNMRKIIAVLAAVLMLCCVIPMGAMSVSAAPGDVIIDADFNDGMDGFNNYSVADGALVLDGTSANWANSYAYTNAIKPNTTYQVNFRAKADTNKSLSFKINNGWVDTNVSASADITTEWAEYELLLTPDSNLTDPIFTIQTGTYAVDGTVYYIDYVTVKEYQDPADIGKVINTSFEDGLTGWATDSSASLYTDDAYEGSNSLKLSNTGYYASAATQEVPVKANTAYELVWYSKRLSGTGAFNIILCQTVSPWANYTRVAGQNWMNETSGNWVKNSYTVNTGDNTSMLIKWTSERSGDAGEILLDAIQLIEIKEASDDGFIKNGDFETGKANPWTLYSDSVVSADAAKDGDYGLYVKHPSGNWNGTAYQDFTVEVGKTYVVTMDVKALSNGQNIQIQNPIGTNVGSNWYTKTDWNTLTYEFTATATDARINICGGGTGGNEEIYVDNVFVFEKKDASSDGYIVNGDFETGETAPWSLHQSTVISADAAHTGNFGVHIVGVGNWGGLLEQDISGLVVGHTYRFSFWMKMNHQGVNVKIGDSYLGWYTAVGDWTLVTHEFTATATTAKILINGGGDGNADPSIAADLYVDDFSIVELIDPSFDGYIYNGDFETGDLHPWDNLWGSCPTVEIVEGMDGGYGLHIVSGKWLHVRQTGITVEANTWYKVTMWAKNTNNMCVLVKDGGDSDNLLNNNFSAGDEWTEISYVFNSGEYTTIILSLMGGDYDEDGERYGTFDNISMEVTEEPACEHKYDDCLDVDCNLCGEIREAGHSLTYFEAVVAANCQETGHDEYWYCENCGCYFGDAEASWQHNPGWLFTTGECVRPEDAADCATVPCEVCGEDVYGYGEHDVLACKGGTCSKCNAEIEGCGCQNYDTPACEDGVCYYCGGFVAGFGHENGAWAPCLDGECSYGCGLTYPATEDHVDEDADDYCDTCWNHLAHIDEDADGWCDICWSEIPQEPVEILYGDANGDGIVDGLDEILLAQYNAGWEVELDMVAADANGDGIVDGLDEILLAQYNAGWEVTLGA